MPVLRYGAKLAAINQGWPGEENGNARALSQIDKLECLVLFINM